MDYKEKYEQALERAKSKIKDDKDHVLYEDDIIDIFPELKESGDDEHRKWILEYLYDGLRKSDEQFKEQFKTAIAWFEKQVIKEHNVCDICDAKASCVNPCPVKLVEQKPADNMEREYNTCYNMSFEEAQEYISNRGFDIPWTDCDVFVDFRYVTQTVANILRWADNNPKQKPAWS